MAAEFVTVIAVCFVKECPNFEIETVVPARLDEHGCLPWIVCGVCSEDIVEHPHREEEVS